jgi:hypothetical protein
LVVVTASGCAALSLSMVAGVCGRNDTRFAVSQNVPAYVNWIVATVSPLLMICAGAVTPTARSTV